MNISKLIFAVVLFCTFYGCTKKEDSLDSKLSGMWKLDKFESLDNGMGKWAYDSNYIGWTGYIIYDGHGHMGVELTPKGYRDFDASKNIDSLNNQGLKDLVKFYKTNMVYFADYKITGNMIEHKRLSATEPKDWGTTLIRDFEFKGEDTLLLTPREIMFGVKSRLVWIKN